MRLMTFSHFAQFGSIRMLCLGVWIRSDACRFRLMQGAIDPAADPSKHDLSIFACDLLAKLDATIIRVTDGYESFRFSDIAQALYDFTWGDFCDRFIEAAKADFDSPRRAGTLAAMDFTIGRVLKLLHPYTPFITEELWTGLGFGAQSLMETPWPVPCSAARSPAPTPSIPQFPKPATCARPTTFPRINVSPGSSLLRSAG